MAYESTIFYNGEYIDTRENELTLPFEERAFQFGDGIYEVIRLYDGKFFTLDEHLTRLYRSLKEIRVDIAWSQEEVKEILINLVKKNDFQKDGQVYLQISRGNAPRNHVFPAEVVPNFIAYVKEANRPFTTMKNGVHAYLADDIRWLRCDIKSLNLLPNVLAKQSALEKGGYEAIFHRSGVVTEGSASNMYMVKDGKVFTHPPTNLILNGITRIQIKALCLSHNIPFVEESFTVQELGEADEVFLSSTTSEVTPIIMIDDNKVGNGAVGTVTKSIQRLFEEHAFLNNRTDKLS